MFDLLISLLVLSKDGYNALWEIQEELDINTYVYSGNYSRFRPMPTNADIVRDLSNYYWSHVGGGGPRRLYALYEKGEAIEMLANLWDEYLERNAA
jgi:hypothetical protein